MRLRPHSRAAAAGCPHAAPALALLDSPSSHDPSSSRRPAAPLPDGGGWTRCALELSGRLSCPSVAVCDCRGWRKRDADVRGKEPAIRAAAAASERGKRAEVARRESQLTRAGREQSRRLNRARLEKVARRKESESEVALLVGRLLARFVAPLWRSFPDPGRDLFSLPSASPGSPSLSAPRLPSAQ